MERCVENEEKLTSSRLREKILDVSDSLDAQFNQVRRFQTKVGDKFAKNLYRWDTEFKVPRKLTQPVQERYAYLPFYALICLEFPRELRFG